MDLQIIKTEKEYEDLLDLVDQQFDLKPDLEVEADSNILGALSRIKQYEDAHYAIPFPQK